MTFTAGAQGDLSNVYVAPSNAQVGAFAIYSVSFQTSLSGNGIDAGVPADGRIAITFPSSLNLSGVEIAANVYGLDGGFSSIDVSGQTIVLQRDNTGSALAAGGSVILKVAAIRNSTIADIPLTATVETQDSSGTIIDGPSTSSSFTLNAAPLQGFVFSPISSQIAGEDFPFSVTAQDVFGNKVLHTGTVHLSDNTGTLSLASLYFINQQTQSSSVHITLAQGGVLITAEGNGKTGQSNAISVAPNILHHLKIKEGSSGNTEDIGDRTISADKTLKIHASGFDRFDNYINDVTVNWLVNGDIGSLAPQNNSIITEFSPEKTGVGTISTIHPAAINDTTGTIVVTVGEPHHIKVLSETSGNTAELDDIIVTSGNLIYAHCSSFDTDDNYITDVQASWRVSGEIGTVTPVLGKSTQLYTIKSGSGTIVAQHATLGDESSGLIRVNSGTLASIKVVEGLTGDGSKVGEVLLTADEVLVVHAAGYDATGNYIGDQTVTWSSTGDLAPVISQTGTSISYAPTLAPASGRIRASHSGVANAETGFITVSVGPPKYIKILSNLSGLTSEVNDVTLTTGQTLQVHASSLDADHNYIEDTAVSWILGNQIGILNPISAVATTLTATRAGSGFLKAVHTTLMDDATGTITVSAGALYKIRIVEGSSGDGAALPPLNLTTDDVLTVHAAGYDQADNYIGDQSVTWSVDGNLGAISSTSGPSTTLILERPGTGRILAQHGTVKDESSGLLTVKTGVLHHVKVTTGSSGNTPPVGNTTLTTDLSLTVHAGGFDADDNYVGDYEVVWRLQGNIGSVSPIVGSWTTLAANRIGTGQIIADHLDVLDDQSGLITVTGGTLAYIKIVEGSSGHGVELTSRSLNSDQSLTVHAAGYDADHNYIGDWLVTWSSSGTLAPAVSATGSTYSFLPTRAPATGQIHATHSSGHTDATGTISVQVGNLDHIKVLTGNTGNTSQVTNTTVSTDETLTIHAGVFDADDNYIGDAAVSWRVEGNIGFASPMQGIWTLFTPTNIGNGQIVADHPAAMDGQTGIITVTAGVLEYIKIVEGPAGDGSELGDRTLNTDQTLRLHAAGYDADDNYTGDQSVSWHGTGSLVPVVSGNGSRYTFEPTKAPASGKIYASHLSAGTDTTGTLSIEPGTLHHVKLLTGGGGSTIPLGDITVFPGQALIVHAGGFDADDNYIDDINVNWSVIGVIGSIQPATGIQVTFTAHTAGSGKIFADAPGSILDGTSGYISVVKGELAKIVIRTASNNRGVPFLQYTMTTDDEVTLYAAGYDAGDNYLGDVVVSWSNTGNLSPSISMSAAYISFSPDKGDAGGTVKGNIAATFSPDVYSITGDITVFPGQPYGPIELSANPSYLPADGTSRTLVTSSAIKDMEGNPVGPGRFFTVALTPPDFGTIVTPDADESMPNHQIRTNSSSELNFSLQAGSLGGVATISVNNNLASGHAQITLGSLAIVSVTADHAFISQGQQNIKVTMSVANLGTETITDLQGHLRFKSSVDQTSDFEIIPHPGNSTSIPGNSTLNLVYSVNASSTIDLGSITIDGSVSGRLGTIPVNASNAQNTSTITVQRMAALKINSIFIRSDTLSQGQTHIPVNVLVENQYGFSNVADAIIDSIRLVFKLGPVIRNQDYIVSLDQGLPFMIPGGTSQEISFTVNISSSAALGTISVDGEVFGRDWNSKQPIVDRSADSLAHIAVIESESFAILSLTPSLKTITENMIKVWSVRMQLINAGASSVTLDLAEDKTFIRFLRGSSDVTSEYTYIQPTELDEGGFVLPPGEFGHLSFRIFKSGSSAGLVTLLGFVQGIENATGLRVTDDNLDAGRGEITVQSEGRLNITLVQSSQLSATAGRAYDWRINANVQNTGGSAVKLLSDSIFISINEDTSYQFIKPLTFTDGDSIIDANESKELEFIVDRTGLTTGVLPITVKLSAAELNSNRIVYSNIGGNSILVQSPAELKIVNIKASQPSVTTGQTNPWTITVTMENRGESLVKLADTPAHLGFNLDQTPQDDYDYAMQPGHWLGSGTPYLGGNKIDSLRFMITLTGAISGFPAVSGAVNVTETNSASLLQAILTKDSLIQVQTPPEIQYIPGSLHPDIVNNNSYYHFSLRVRNLGQASFFLKPGQTLFRFSDGQNQFLTLLDANYVTEIAPGDTTLTFQQAQIPGKMTPGMYAPVLDLNGYENNNAFSQQLITTENSLSVQQPARVQIISLQPSQNTVTSLMDKIWYIDMVVANNGGADIRLENARVILYNEGDVSSQYNMANPEIFQGSNSAILAPARIDTLRFEVRKTGVKLGGTTIQGRLWVVDQSNQTQLFIQEDAGSALFVQSPAALKITKLVPSQPTITQNQLREWMVNVHVSNLGGSIVDVDFDSSATFIALSSQIDNDYAIEYPATFLSGKTSLEGGGQDILRFKIKRSGSKTGQNIISAQVTGLERNSGTPRFDDTADVGKTVVVVQSPALLSITNVLPSAAVNLPFVNTNQTFNINIRIKNKGQETADSIRVRLTTNGQSLINQAEILIQSGLLGSQELPVSFAVTAASDADPQETFTGMIISARAHNSGDSVPVEPSLEDSTIVMIQRPALLDIEEVLPSKKEISAEQEEPWLIKVVVANKGESTIDLDAPGEEDIKLKISDTVQRDYVLEPPAYLSSSGNLVLEQGQRDTLIYRVISTGRRGGQVAITVQITGKDRNIRQTLVDENAGTIKVQTIASVRILNTQIQTYNYQSNTNIGLVNISQAFSVHVTLENPGIEDVKELNVLLITNGNSKINYETAYIDYFPAQEKRTAVYYITADSLPTSENVRETFTATITAALAAQSQEKAVILTAIDSTASVQIQMPARLDISAHIDDNDRILGSNQIFNITGFVENLGGAEVDESGKLKLILPDKFELAGPEPDAAQQPFTVASPVKWRVRAPNQSVENARITIRISKIPNDKNGNDLALVETDSLSIYVTVVEFDLSIAKFFISKPQGAYDAVLSTGQRFTITANFSMSDDLAEQPRSVTLFIPKEYNYLSPATINGFSETESWEITAPMKAHDAKWFIIEAEGQLATGQRITDKDSLAVTLVNRALLQLEAYISEPEGARDNTLSINQPVTIRINVNNMGSAATLDTAKVRLSLGQSGLINYEAPVKPVKVDSFVEWSAITPAFPADGIITVRLEQLPFDENSNLRAEVISEFVTFHVYTDSAGTLTISAPQIKSPAGAVDNILSTGQEFTVSADLKWLKLKNVAARLLLPPDFFTEEQYRNFGDENGESSPSWIVRSPYQAVLSQTIYIALGAFDADNDTLAINHMSDTLNVDVVDRARLRLDGFISGPQAARDGIVSLDQIFQIQGMLYNLGQAYTIGYDSIRIVLPPGYTTEEPPVKSSVNGMVNWNVKAGSAPSSSIETIRLVLDQRPLDENSGQPVLVEVGEVTISIQSESKVLLVEQIPIDATGPSASGQKNNQLMSVKLTNPGNEFSNDIILKSMNIYVYNRHNQLINPNNALEKIRLVSHYEPSRILSTVASMPAANPVTLALSTPDTIRSDSPDFLNIVLDLSESPNSDAFYLQITSGDDIYAIDSGSGERIQITDPAGNTGEFFKLSSRMTVLTKGSIDNFYNYPNPFKPGGSLEGGTHFWYYLPKDSRVEFKIYTLLGELVYEKTFDITSPQGHTGGRIKYINDIFWNGRNGDGIVVLNGVYIAVLKTNSGTVTTKIAVAK